MSWDSLCRLPNLTRDFNISTLDHMEILTGHFDREIDFDGSEGLGGTEVDHIKPSCRSTSFQ